MWSDVAQRTPEWHKRRAGLVGGSEARHINARRKGTAGETAGRRDLRVKLALETLTATPMEQSQYLNEDISRGITLEDRALREFALSSGLLISNGGHYKSEIRKAGVSPDGRILSSEDGISIVEIKCPRAANHLAAFALRRASGLAAIPATHRAQLIHGLLVAEDADGIYYVSFSDQLLIPELELYSVFLKRVDVQDEIAAYACELDRFLAEVEDEIGRISQLRDELTPTTVASDVLTI
jgi:hypothetical protein